MFRSSLGQTFQSVMVYNHIMSYPTPANLSYFWNFGSLSGIFLAIQILTGILLAMHYTSDASLAFLSTEHIMRDVLNGSFLRYLHANGASMFFIVVYLHIARSLYYRSYRSMHLYLWFSGLIIFLLMMATAFIGYVLPWGQMSYWGATVITNLFSAIPVVGQYFVQWLWGGFSVGNATLTRFFSLHYLLPFLITGLVFFHLAHLHEVGSSNTFPMDYKHFNVIQAYFAPYFIIKDILGLFCFFIVYFFFVSFIPNYLGHSDNYIEANPIITPTHIVPEWYFLPFYAILRAIPDKLGGIILMISAIVIFFALPIWSFYFLRFSSQPSVFVSNTVQHKLTVWCLYISVFMLGWLGAQVVEEPYASLGLLFSILYFLCIFYLF